MIKPGVLRVKTMKSISHPQVTVLEIKPVFRSLHYTIQFDGCFFFFCFFFFATAFTIFYLLFPFWIVHRNKIMFPKLLRKMLRGTNQKIYDYCTCSGLQAEKNWISRPENSIEYRSVFEHWAILKWTTISRERASVYSTPIAKTGGVFHA